MTSRPIQVVVHESLHVVASLERDFRGSKTINRPRRDRSLFKGPFRLTGAVDIATIHSDPSSICPFWRGHCVARKQAKPCVITKGGQWQWLPVFVTIPLYLVRFLPVDLRLTPEPLTILEEPARGTFDQRQRTTTTREEVAVKISRYHATAASQPLGRARICLEGGSSSPSL